jgi:hypothetical protein
VRRTMPIFPGWIGNHDLRHGLAKTIQNLWQLIETIFKVKWYGPHPTSSNRSLMWSFGHILWQAFQEAAIHFQCDLRHWHGDSRTLLAVAKHYGYTPDSLISWKLIHLHQKFHSIHSINLTHPDISW